MTGEPTPRMPRRSGDSQIRRSHRGGVLPLPDAPGAVALNPTALALWELCDGRTTVDEMVTGVCALFAIDAARARDDIEAALAQMRAAGVIT